MAIHYQKYNRGFHKLMKQTHQDSIDLYYAEYQKLIDGFIPIFDMIYKDYNMKISFPTLQIQHYKKELKHVLKNKLLTNDIENRNHIHGIMGAPFKFYKPIDIHFQTKKLNHLDTLKGKILHSFYHYPFEYDVKVNGISVIENRRKGLIYNTIIDTTTIFNIEVSHLNNNFEDTTFSVQHKIRIE